jgi:hypothetical protein
MRRTPLVLTVSLLLAADRALADDTNVGTAFRLSGEVDPVPFFEHGFSVHAAVKPGNGLRFTLGTFGLTVPTPASGSANDGWNAKQRAIEVSASYSILDVGKSSLYGGLYLFAQRWSYERVDVAGNVVSYWVSPAPALGFQWLPWGKGLYIVPWAALGFPIRGSAPRLGGRVYDEPKLFPVLALHLGYEFAV